MRVRARDVVAALLAALPVPGAFSAFQPDSGDFAWAVNGFFAVASFLLALAFFLWRSGRDPQMPTLGEVGARTIRAALASFVAGMAVSAVLLATEVLARTEQGGAFVDTQVFGTTDNLAAAALMWGLVVGFLTPLPVPLWRLWSLLRAVPFGLLAAYLSFHVDEASERAHPGLGMSVAFGVALVLLLQPLRFWRPGYSRRSMLATEMTVSDRT